jgi:hypothetical protein
MATSFSIADTHDNEAGYAAFDPQPNMPDGIQYLVHRKAASGLVYPDGVRVAILQFDRPTPTQVSTILTAAGLSTTVTSNGVTVALPDDDDKTTFSDYNATAYYLRTREYLGRYFNGHYEYLRIKLEITGDT